MANITLAVSGSISAYKAADLANQLTKMSHQVTVLMTSSATEFISPLTLQSLTKNKVQTDLLLEEDPQSIKHIDIAKQTDLFLLAPASANTIAKLAHGFANDMVSAVSLALPPETPKLVAPAMNTNMYFHPATQRNIALLKEDGFVEIAPRESLLACGDIGTGALADLSVILDLVKESLNEKK
ncbi:phosphopantothenoylcysteine decarboxylase [Streptococcus sp. DD13]|uniref:phosphopantothenoylcysteine decarboxylase n=1 Tax=Streptococcus sp. DD13 TaxID=1777881 RepID=UPI0007913DAE|nr:phosphopantothenoylcysteine decarboxylase [Streptococcus sp. DD13]KXT78760.1 Phosphopantothenoylcysteine decarboxylase [Streptococcus sp. DD13]